MNTLGVICARGGSKVFPGKNIIPFNGEPLILRSVKRALRSIHLADVVVSTDCDYVKRLAEGLVEVIDRPPALANDDSPIHEAVLHALVEMERRKEAQFEMLTPEECQYGIVVCLQNSQPFRTPEDIDRALKLLEQRPECQTVMTVVRAERHHPALSYTTNTIGKLIRLASMDESYRRQDRDPIYFMSGNVFAMNRDAFMENPHVPCGDIYPLEIPEHRSMDIHNWHDWRIAEAMEGIHHG